jgi:DNA-binding NarL/FixJ family response regulator
MPAQRKPIKVILVEDDHSLREALAQMVRLSAELELVGEYPDVELALSDIIETPAPVVLLDVFLADGKSGIESIRTIKTMNPYSKVLLLTGDCQSSTIISGFRAGADGYMLKEDAIMGLGEHIHNLVRHGWCISPGVVGSMIRIVNNPLLSEAAPPALDLNGLTKTQLRVLQELAIGDTYEDIGGRLNMARNTVNQHVQRIYRKLGIKSRAELLIGLK